LDCRQILQIVQIYDRNIKPGGDSASAEIGLISGNPASQWSQYRLLSCPNGFAPVLSKWRFSASHSSGARFNAQTAASAGRVLSFTGRSGIPHENDALEVQWVWRLNHSMRLCDTCANDATISSSVRVRGSHLSGKSLAPDQTAADIYREIQQVLVNEHLFWEAGRCFRSSLRLKYALPPR
jgi:hypothetical protein